MLLPLHEAASASLGLTDYAVLAGIAFVLGRIAFGPFVASSRGEACPSEESHGWHRGTDGPNYCPVCGEAVEPIEVDGSLWRARDGLLDRARNVRDAIASEVRS